MLNAISFRTKIILVIIGLIMLLGLSYILGPAIVLSTFHFERDNFLISPLTENYNYMLLAYGILIVALSVLAWRKTKWTIIGAIAGVILFGYYSFASTQGYFALHKDYVIMKTAKSEQKFYWNELTNIEYTNDFNGIPETLIFNKGKDSITMDTTGQFTYPVITKVRNMASKNGIPYDKIKGK